MLYLWTQEWWVQNGSVHLHVGRERRGPAAQSWTQERWRVLWRPPRWTSHPLGRRSALSMKSECLSYASVDNNNELSILFFLSFFFFLNQWLMISKALQFGILVMVHDGPTLFWQGIEYSQEQQHVTGHWPTTIKEMFSKDLRSIGWGLGGGSFRE